MFQRPVSIKVASNAHRNYPSLGLELETMIGSKSAIDRPSQSLEPQHRNLVRSTCVELASIFTLCLSVSQTHLSAAAQNNRLILNDRHLSLLLHNHEVHPQALLIEFVAERANLPDLF